MKGVKGGLVLTLLGVMGLPVANAAQDGYQVEMGVGYLRAEDDDSGSTSLTADAELYFSPVRAGHHPLAEAAFLERAGSVRLIARSSDYDYDAAPGIEATRYGLDFTYARSAEPLVLGAGFLTEKVDVEPPANGDGSVDSLSVVAGTFLRDGQLVVLGYEHVDADLSANGWSVSKAEADAYSLAFKGVYEHADDSAVNIEFHAAREDFDDFSGTGSNTILGVGGDYYVDRFTSFGASLSSNTGDKASVEGNTVGCRFRMFLNPRFSVSGELKKFIAENDGTDDRQTGFVGMAARF